MMSKKLGKPILVTGSIRSGTTWVGRILSYSPDVVYIHEPFNIFHKIGICGMKWENQFSYVFKENEGKIFEAIKDTINFKYNTFKEILAIRKPRNIAGFIRDFTKFYYWHYIIHPRPLIKDPIALFSAEWLAKTFNMDVIVLIRHPAAFAWSCKRLNETNYFSHLLNQKELIEDLLSPFKEEIKKLAVGEHDIIDRAILMWNITTFIFDKYSKNHPDWIFKKHEDLSLNPLEEFRDIFSHLSLDYSEKVQNVIRRKTNSQNPIEALEGVRHQLKRNSKENVFAWKKRLSPSDIDRIRLGTSELCHFFYSDDTWI